ncbi:MAG TPA: AAA family ATPase [Lachnospiraceae bacterium]|nr:AAA family ATPase [Lachnospiraceae bacterium]
MIYLHYFKFASWKAEEDFIFSQRRTCYDTYYPFQIYPQKGFERIDFSDITILYGGNGSGKSTALNLIANRIEADRETVYNRSNFFEEYLDKCSIEYADTSFKNKAIITSDGVFDSMLDIRNLNQNIDHKREDLFDEYMQLKYTSFQLKSLADVEKLRKSNMAKSKTQSKFVRKTLVNNMREYSNGESAFQYFKEKIDENGIYILDEPENSLSPHKQLELVKFLEDSARFFQCQLIISTHSPFLLAMKGAKIYDLDSNPVDVRTWTELENVRSYFDFFMVHKDEFE